MIRNVSDVNYSVAGNQQQGLTPVGYYVVFNTDLNINGSLDTNSSVIYQHPSRNQNTATTTNANSNNAGKSNVTSTTVVQHGANGKDDESRQGYESDNEKQRIQKRKQNKNHQKVMMLSYYQKYRYDCRILDDLVRYTIQRSSWFNIRICNTKSRFWKSRTENGTIIM